MMTCINVAEFVKFFCNFDFFFGVVSNSKQNLIPQKLPQLPMLSQNFYGIRRRISTYFIVSFCSHVEFSYEAKASKILLCFWPKISKKIHHIKFVFPQDALILWFYILSRNVRFFLSSKRDYGTDFMLWITQNL